MVTLTVGRASRETSYAAPVRFLFLVFREIDRTCEARSVVPSGGDTFVRVLLGVLV